MKKLFLPLFLFLNLCFVASTQAQTSETTPDSEELVFTFVEQQPEYPGGQEAMMKFLAENIRYPATALQANIEGLVITQFVVNKHGQITDINTLKQLGGGTDEEAIRVIAAMPNWQPGKQNGKEVSVRYVLPIRFEFATKKKKRKAKN